MPDQTLAVCAPLRSPHRAAARQRGIATSVAAMLLMLAATVAPAAEIRVGIAGCTLADAIRAANADAARGSCNAGNGHDLIRLPGATVQVAGSALPTLRSAITLRGDAAGAVVSGSNQHRVLHIEGADEVLIENLGIVDGEVGGVGGRGGAGLLIEDSEVTLRDVSVRFNVVEPGLGVLQGGGLRALESVVRIEDSLFEVNKAGENFGGGSRGGNIAVTGGHLTIERSTIRGYAFKDADFAYLGNSGAQRGAGLWAQDAVIELRDSLFTQHVATAGVDLALEGSTVDIVNSTFYHDHMSHSRILRDADSELRLYNSTLWTKQRSVGIAGSGDLRIHNSLLVGGVAAMCEFEDGIGSVTQSIASRASDDSCFGTGTATASMSTWLDPPTGHGGPTATARLRTFAGNLAINGGDPATCTAHDQRGVDRGAACDIGAYEVDDEADLSGDLVLLTPAPHYLGQTLTWRARVTNHGPADAIGVSLSFTLSGATLQGWSGSGACTGLSCRIERINPDASATVLLHAMKGPQPSFDATLVVNNVTDYAQDPEPDNNSDTTGNGGSLSTAADVSVRQLLTTPSPWAIGQLLQFQIQVQNHGPNTASMIDVNHIVTGLGNPTFGGCDQLAGSTCRIDTLGAGASRNLTASATITGSATRSEFVVASTLFDPKPANNRDAIRLTTATRSDVSVRMRTEPSPPHYPTQAVSWVIEVGNAGPDPATNVSLDPELTNAELLGTDATCPLLPCVLPVLDAGSSLVLTWQGETGAPGPFSHRITVAADQTDPTPANNSAVSAGTVQAASDPVAYTWLLTPPTHYAGNQLQFGAQIHNAGPNAVGVFELQLEMQNLEILAIQSPRCAALPCFLPQLEVGEENGETFSITAQITQPGQFWLRTRAASSTYDVIPGNSASIVIGTAIRHPDDMGMFGDGFE